MARLANAGHGRAGLGLVEQDTACLGMVGHGAVFTLLSSPYRATLKPTVWQGVAGFWQGVARRGMAGRDLAMQGLARSGVVRSIGKRVAVEKSLVTRFALSVIVLLILSI